ncbi:membrane protein [Spirochaetia bacterium]|nr:membrane protein [Spirochaetia bacterium]GHU33446.1 membrane protein [Spirochaetia bacterium]
MAKLEERDVKISYMSKDKTVCPACGAFFYREELLSGSGRLIAGAITDELHRLYEPSVKYGNVYPLAYVATVCPECLFASLDKDFENLPVGNIGAVREDEDQRFEDFNKIFSNVDFEDYRDLRSGTASLYLALRCYDFYNKETSPTIKQAVSAIRTAWLFEELHKTKPAENYDWLALLFKQKSLFLYTQAIAKEQSGKETLSGMSFLGPDTDKNYGYEGALYLIGLLEFKYGQTEDREQRVARLSDSKRTIAKIFGIGKSSKEKPGPLLEHARNLYEKLAKILNEDD